MQWWHGDMRDRRVPGAVVAVFAVGEEFLVHLLTGPQAGVDDRCGMAGDHHQFAGEINDADRGAHIEHQGLPGAADGGRLDDQLHGLGDRHQKAGDVRVGHRDRQPLGQLLSEGRQHRTLAAQYIAEPHRQKHRLIVDSHGGEPDVPRSAWLCRAHCTGWPPCRWRC